MTHDKVRQDFEAWASEQPYFATGYSLEETFNGGYQAGRAAERAEIREKLESEEALIDIAEVIRFLPTVWQGDSERTAKAAITKILEVI